MRRYCTLQQLQKLQRELERRSDQFLRHGELELQENTLPFLEHLPDPVFVTRLSEDLQTRIHTGHAADMKEPAIPMKALESTRALVEPDMNLDDLQRYGSRMLVGDMPAALTRIFKQQEQLRRMSLRMYRAPLEFRTLPLSMLPEDGVWIRFRLPFSIVPKTGEEDPDRCVTAVSLF